MSKLGDLEDLFKNANVLNKRTEFINKATELLTNIETKIKEDNQILCDIKEINNNSINGVNKIIRQAQTSQPWLSKALSEFRLALDVDVINYLKGKKHPAYAAAEQIRVIAKDKKEYLRRLKEAEYKIAYYESLFPDIVDVIEEEDEVTLELEFEPEKDEVLQYVSQSEYINLSESERNQKALDRYFIQIHSKKHIGKMYERYIGYLYEMQGFIVEYHGIKLGLNDLGRDLICKKNGEIHIVQCKCWSKKKMIHENAICQLYGTAIKYKIDNDKKTIDKGELFAENVTPVFISTVHLSETAQEFAESIGVRINIIPFSKHYPTIKCNINNSERIYHLPFDQMYDLTYIRNKGERYVKTVEEAEDYGFRRAKRHAFNNT